MKTQSALKMLKEIQHQRDALEQKLEKAEHDRDSWEAQCHVAAATASELVAFARLVEPYVSNAHCHGNSELDRKLYAACVSIRPILRFYIK